MKISEVAYRILNHLLEKLFSTKPNFDKEDYIFPTESSKKLQNNPSLPKSKIGREILGNIEKLNARRGSK